MFPGSSILALTALTLPEISLINFEENVKALGASLLLPQCKFLNFLSVPSNGFLMGLSRVHLTMWYSLFPGKLCMKQPSAGLSLLQVYIYQVLFQEDTPHCS